MKTLVPVLGDRLTVGTASLRGARKADTVVLMMEVAEETGHVRHHRRKLAYILSAMRHHAADLERRGWTVAGGSRGHPRPGGAISPVPRRRRRRRLLAATGSPPQASRPTSNKESMMDPLVTTEWLAGELGANDLRVVDATYFLPADGKDAAADYEKAHIPGAVFMDLEGLADSSSDLPMMLPSPEKFASRMQTLGLGDGSRIVLYDHSPYHTAARAWFMLRTFGAHDVAILDGGFAKWQAEGCDTASGREQLRHRHFTVWADAKGVRSLDQMKANLDRGSEQVLDARSAARFTGEEPDPRPATHAGHIPGSKNLPQGRLFDADGTWKRGDALKAEFDAAGIDLARPLVTTCGSGITASVLAFGAHLLGNDAAVYDGSWSEWGADRSTPKATGAA